MEDIINILLVDDEEDILEILEYNLSKAGYNVKTTTNGEEALTIIENKKPDLIVLDIMMPEIDGIELCEKIRSNPDNTNILIAFLTARSESFTQITALETGADTYITKPIKPNLFLSKIKAILRRHPKMNANGNSDEQSYGNLRVFPNEYRVEINGESITLPKKEFELLNLLISKPGKVFKRGEILNKVWGHGVIVGDRTIDVHIRKLREKIGSESIKTLKGVGYRFNA